MPHCCLWNHHILVKMLSFDESLTRILVAQLSVHCSHFLLSFYFWIPDSTTEIQLLEDDLKRISICLAEANCVFRQIYAFMHTVQIYMGEDMGIFSDTCVVIARWLHVVNNWCSSHSLDILCICYSHVL